MVSPGSVQLFSCVPALSSCFQLHPLPYPPQIDALPPKSIALSSKKSLEMKPDFLQCSSRILSSLSPLPHPPVCAARSPSSSLVSLHLYHRPSPTPPSIFTQFSPLSLSFSLSLTRPLQAVCSLSHVNHINLLINTRMYTHMCCHVCRFKLWSFIMRHETHTHTHFK